MIYGVANYKSSVICSRYGGIGAAHFCNEKIALNEELMK